MNHLMIDSETMGTQPTAAIVAIGAVFFEPSTGELGPTFYTVLDLKSELDRGAIAEADAIIWWLKQSSEARSAITNDVFFVSGDKALNKLSDFVYDNHHSPSKLKVWGNGSGFDNVLLLATFERHGVAPFWNFYNDRDVRTIVELGRAIGFDPKHEMPFDGERHNALADAKHQAKYVSAIWQRLVPPASTETDINM